MALAHAAPGIAYHFNCCRWGWFAWQHMLIRPHFCRMTVFPALARSPQSAAYATAFRQAQVPAMPERQHTDLGIVQYCKDSAPSGAWGVHRSRAPMGCYKLYDDHLPGRAKRAPPWSVRLCPCTASGHADWRWVSCESCRPHTSSTCRLRSCCTSFCRAENASASQPACGSEPDC